MKQKVAAQKPKVVIVLGRSGVERVKSSSDVEVIIFDDGYEFPDDENQRAFYNAMDGALRSCPVEVEPEVINQDK